MLYFKSYPVLFPGRFYFVCYCLMRGVALAECELVGRLLPYVRALFCAPLSFTTRTSNGALCRSHTHEHHKTDLEISVIFQPKQCDSEICSKRSHRKRQQYRNGNAPAFI